MLAIQMPVMTLTIRLLSFAPLWRDVLVHQACKRILTDERLHFNLQVAALEVRVGPVSVQHNLGNAFVDQFIVLWPGGQ